MKHALNFGSVLFLLIFSAGCESPILNHRVKSKPSGEVKTFRTLGVQQTTVETAQADAPPDECENSFNDTDYCMELEFTEEPSFQESLHAFEAELRIWNRKTGLWFDSSNLPQVHHKSPLSCCAPPPIEVQKISKGHYRLSGIEFHAAGIFDFLVEITGPDNSTLEAKAFVEVAE